MTVSLPIAIETRLKQQASRLGMDASEYAGRLIAEHLPPTAPVASLTDLFAEWDAEDTTDDLAELRRRNEEFEELKQAMNRSREEMEGPQSRKLWP